MRLEAVSVLNRLDRGADLHFVADQEAAGFERRVPEEPIVLAVHGQLGLEADARVANGSFASPR
jgi:hypothetical protein